MRQTNEAPQRMTLSNFRPVAVVACEDPEIRHILVSVLKEFGLEPLLPEKVDDLGNLLDQQHIVIVFIQTRFEKVGYRDVLSAADRPGSKVPVVVCSEFYDKDLYLEAMAEGAFDYLATPYSHDEVAWVVSSAVHREPFYSTSYVH